MADLLHVIISDSCHLLVLVLLGLLFLFSIQWTVQKVKQCWISPCICPCFKKQQQQQTSKRAAGRINLTGKPVSRPGHLWFKEDIDQLEPEEGDQETRPYEERPRELGSLAGDRDTNAEPGRSWHTTTNSERSSHTTTDSEMSCCTTTDTVSSWHTTTDSERRTPPSASDTSLLSIISLCSWAESSAGNPAKIPHSASNTSLGSVISICSWVESSAGEAPCSSRSSGTAASLALEGDAQVLQPHQGRVRPRHLRQKPQSYPHVDFDQHSKGQKRQRVGSMLRSSSMTSLIPTPAPSLHPTTKSKGRPTYLQGHSQRAGVLDYKHQELLEWHIHKKHQAKITPPSLWVSGTSPQTALANTRRRDRMELQPSLQKPHSCPQGEVYEKQKLLEWDLHEKYQEKDTPPPAHRESSSEGRTQDAISDVSYWGERGLHQPPQKLRPYSHIDFNLRREELQGQWAGPMLQSDSTRRLIPAASSVNLAVRPKGSQAHFQGRGSRIRFLSYKEQELLEWNIHKKRRQKDSHRSSSPSHRCCSPEAKMSGMAHGYQPHRLGLGLQHPPQQPHSYSHLDSSLHEKKLHRQHKGPTPQFHLLSKGIPTSASLQPTSKGKGSPACFQGHGDRVNFLGSKEQELLAFRVQEKHGEKEAIPSHRTSRPKAQTQADVAPGWQSRWGKTRPQRVHQKPHSYPLMGTSEEQVLCDWNVYKKHEAEKGPSHRTSSTGREGAARRSSSMTRLVPAAPYFCAESKGKGNPAHIQEQSNKTGVLGCGEWELLACNAQKKRRERSVTPSHRVSSRAGGPPTLQSDLPTRSMTTSPSARPAGKGAGSAAHLQGSRRETRARSLADVPPGAIMQWVSQRLPKASSLKAKPVDPSLPLSIMKSVDKEKAMRDLHMCLAQGLEKGGVRPYVEYPVCLQCGHCTPFCPHPRSRQSPSLLVYPRLRVRNGEVHMSLGFLLKVKRREADRWGLEPGVDASKMRLGREHPSQRERSREVAANAGAERTRHQLKDEHRRSWETVRQHRRSEQSRSPARQHSREGAYLQNRDPKPPPGSRRVSFLATDKPPLKPSKPSSHSHSKKSTRPNQPKEHKKHPTILERLLAYMKKTWAKLRVKKGKRLPSKQGSVASPQKPHFSRSHTEDGDLLNRKSTSETIPASSKHGHPHGPRRVSLQLPEAEASPPAKKRDSHHHHAKSASSKSPKQPSRRTSTRQLRS